MDFVLTYCPTRRSLEENGWILVSRFASASGRLMGLAGGGNRVQFQETKDECADLRQQITASNQALREHRHDHHC